MGTINCSKCKNPLPPDWFANNKTRFNGKASECKPCAKQTRTDRRRRLFAAGVCWNCQIRPLYNRWRCKECNDDTNKKNQVKYLKTKDIVYANYGGKCICCGEQHIKFLSIDHVNGGGKEHRRGKSPIGILRDIIRRQFPPDFQLLCHNCNLGRQLNGGTCPHRETLK